MGIGRGDRMEDGLATTYRKVAFVASRAAEAQESCRHLGARYVNAPPEEADVIVALGGDGFMLETLHRFIDRKLPIYGMNRGTVGFLMNDYRDDGLMERLAAATETILHPLAMEAVDAVGETTRALAINEVALLRETRQAAKIRIRIDDVVRTPELVCDGILVATAAGSTAYNLSAHGPILPLGSELLALTPISAFRPRRWRGALLPARARIAFEILEADKRSVSATADYTEVREVVRVAVAEERAISLRLLFDPGHGLEERILNEQFTP